MATLKRAHVSLALLTAAVFLWCCGCASTELTVDVGEITRITGMVFDTKKNDPESGFPFWKSYDVDTTDPAILAAFRRELGFYGLMPEREPVETSKHDVFFGGKLHLISGGHADVWVMDDGYFYLRYKDTTYVPVVEDLDFKTSGELMVTELRRLLERGRVFEKKPE
jgi:hypothetical protein